MTTDIVTNQKQLEDYLLEAPLITADTETTGLGIDSQLLGASFYDPRQVKAIFIPNSEIFPVGLTPKQMGESLRRINYSSIPCVKHNAKYDLMVMQVNGLPVSNVINDTIAMMHNYDPDLDKNLENSVKREFKRYKPKFEELIGKKWEKVDWLSEAETLLPILAEYAGDDVIATYQIYMHYQAKIDADPCGQAMNKILKKIEVPIAYVLKDMSIAGVRIDTEVLSEIGGRVTVAKKQLVHDIYSEAGTVFNINSGPQKAEVLYKKLGLPILKRTEKGAPSTEADVLDILAKQGYKIAELLAEYSSVQKLESGYIIAIPKHLGPDGKLRCNFNATGTATGRFSSSKPNLQNQPNNSDYPIRMAYIPSVGKTMFGADYSQIELRVMAHEAQDKRMMAAFLNGEDIHGKVASDLGITRKHAKIINFGVLYGMGPESLAANLKLSVREAQRIKDDYHHTYSGFAAWKIQTENFARRNGYVQNMFGRVRRLPTARSGSSSAMRQAVNTAIQGGAADLIKLAMIEAHRVYTQEHPEMGVNFLLQVHDELILEADTNYVLQAYEILTHVMENTIKLTVPLVADGKILDNWYQMKDDDFKGHYELLKSGGTIPLIKSTEQNNNNIIPLWLM